MQQAQVLNGLSIRVKYQGGGSDYAYFANLTDGIIDCGSLLPSPPISLTLVDGPISSDVSGLIKVSFIGIQDDGRAPADASSNIFSQFFDASGNVNVLDDSAIHIPTGGMDFYFFGTNYGAANNIYWNSNNAITFGPFTAPDIFKNTCPAILLGNYDRYCSGVYYGNYVTAGNKFAITKIVVYFSNYYTDLTGLTAGKYQIRLIREETGANRQWVEVTVISSVSSPGYSNNSSVTYPSGTDPSGNPINTNGQLIDSTKKSPYDITNGTNFINVTGTTFSTVSPQTGTSFIYESDSTGSVWEFYNHAYLNI